MKVRGSLRSWVREKRHWVCAALLFVILSVLALDCRLVIRRYAIDADAISSHVRIALITDLHSCYYGEGQTRLLEALNAQEPDVVLLGGDIYDDQRDNTNTEVFLEGICGQYPCYYVTGNHEVWSGEDRFYAMMESLENRFGIPVLNGETVTLQFGDSTVSISGLDDPDRIRFQNTDRLSQGLKQQMESLSAEAAKDGYRILLSHRPEYFETEYKNVPFDLILCGHAHGGQVRIPYLLNGLFAPDQGLFPKYAGGRYDDGARTMIVSRGLARESTAVPRVFNRPELVIIDLT